MITKADTKGSFERMNINAWGFVHSQEIISDLRTFSGSNEPVGIRDEDSKDF